MFKVGSVVSGVTGNFTMLRYVQALGPAEMERTLGFHAGRLAPGFAVGVLRAGTRLTASDIRLLGSTRWSGGNVGRTDTQEGRALAALLAERGQDATLLATKVCTFLNAGGPRAAAKVFPFVAHAPGMLYPDAEALGPGVRSGVPQFNLETPQDFEIVRVHRPG